MLPLVLAQINEEVIIKKIYADDKVDGHLKNLGFFVGSKITRLNDGSTDVIVRIMDSRVGINKDLARRIYVDKE